MWRSSFCSKIAECRPVILLKMNSLHIFCKDFAKLRSRPFYVKNLGTIIFKEQFWGVACKSLLLLWISNSQVDLKLWILIKELFFLFNVIHYSLFIIHYWRPLRAAEIVEKFSTKSAKCATLLTTTSRRCFCSYELWLNK